MYKNKQTLKFYTFGEFESWKKTIPSGDTSAWQFQYYKGLGSSNDEEIADDFKAPKMVSCLYDDSTPETIKLAFNGKLADERKVWISKCKTELNLADLKMMPISQFINEEFVLFSLANIHRSIPRFMDGLKISQRKLLWAAYLHWKFASKPQMKVAQFSALAATKTNYHHGEGSLEKTVVSMAQDFVGSNNMAYFNKKGQFGTRAKGGKDAAASRYIFTAPEWWVSYIFRDEDVPLLTKVVDEGLEVEPVTFLPIIPMGLVNGCSGIATGHSTFIPNYNPLDLIDWIRKKINGQLLPKLLPWYRGYTGKIMIQERKVKKRKAKDSVSLSSDFSNNHSGEEGVSDGKEEEELEDKFGHAEVEDDEITEKTDTDISTTGVELKLSMVTCGDFIWKNDGTVVVSELALGKWTFDYYKWLEKLIFEKKITDKRNLSKSYNVHFEIKGWDNPSTKNLHLERAYGLTNMVLLDNDNRPRKYSTVDDILEKFYIERLPYYEKRRLNLIQELASKILRHDQKIRFIRAIQSGVLVVTNKNTAEVLQKMRELNLPDELLTKTNVKNLTRDDTSSLEEEKAKLEREKIVLESTRASSLWLKDLDEFELAYRKNY